MSIGKRIVQLRKQKNWSQTRLAQEIRAVSGHLIRQQSVAQIERGETRNPRNLSAIAKALGVTESYLRFGDSNSEKNDGALSDCGMVPFLSWESADLCSGADKSLDKAAETFIPCPEQISSSGYALMVKGDAMTSPQPGPLNFPQGTIIFVDPKRTVTPGVPVVARMSGSNECSFKLYVEDAGQSYLRPLNPQYPIAVIDQNTKICGVVVGYYTSLSQSH